MCPLHSFKTLLTSPSCTLKIFYLTALPTASALAVLLNHSYTPQTNNVRNPRDEQADTSKAPFKPDVAHTWSPSTWENEVEEHDYV